MELTFTRQAKNPVPLVAVGSADEPKWRSSLTDAENAWCQTVGFDASAGSVIVFPDQDHNFGWAAFGLGSETSRQRERFVMATVRSKLPIRDYKLSGMSAGPDLDETALGWLLAGYRYTRYAGKPAKLPQLEVPVGVDAARLETIAAAEALTRDLINTPASDMGPDDLEAAAHNLAEAPGWRISVTTGEELLRDNFPMVHAVGRASDQQPRLLEMNWGTSGPKVTLVGKGVCFDTGGLNIKPGASMGLMKKDMGGAATVLGLAKMISELSMPVQLRVLVPAVENSISSNAFRPQDILTSRKGLSVEINNTDAEGRLVLADALTLADEAQPDLIISMATLTGAARVAVGPDIAPFYATDDADADAISTAARQVRDPVWQMPFWDPYEAMIEPGIADLDNAPKGGMAGSITAALFLRRFVTRTPRYLHFDIYGWQPKNAPGRPKGGVSQGARAILEALPQLLGL